MSPSKETALVLVPAVKARPRESKPSKPTRALPTNRVGFTKQLDILRALAAASEPDGKAVSNIDVSKIVGLHAATVGLGNPFLLDIQAVQRTGEGLVPSQEVVAFNRAYQWSPETAAQRLAPLIARTWFAAALLPKLQFGPMIVDKAVQELAMACSAPPAYRGQVETLIEYLKAAGIIIQDGNQVRISQNAPTSDAVGNGDASLAEPNAASPVQPRIMAPITSTFSSNPLAGVVQFNVSVKVDMQEVAGWRPDRIAALFAGIAQVLSAKGAVEEDSAGP
jgi:hypothetical protein